MQPLSRLCFMTILASLPTLITWAGGGHAGKHVPTANNTVERESGILANQTGVYYLTVEQVNGRLSSIDTYGVFAPGDNISFLRNLDRGWISVTLGVYNSSTINENNYVGSLDLTISPDGQGTINGFEGFSVAQFNSNGTGSNVYGLSLQPTSSANADHNVYLVNGSTEYTYYANDAPYPVIGPGESIQMNYTTNNYPSFDIGLCMDPTNSNYAVGYTGGEKEDTVPTRGKWGISLILGTGIASNGVYTNSDSAGIATATISSISNQYTLTFDASGCFPSPYTNKYWVYDPYDNTPPLPSPLQTYSSVPYRGFNLSGAEFENAFQIPDVRCATYYAAKGANTIRLPFAWEYLQGNSPIGDGIDFVNTPRAATYAQTVRDLVSKGFNVIIDMHNYMRFNGVNQMPNGQSAQYQIGSGAGPTADQYAAAWASIALEFGDIPVIFDLMNEPFNISATSLVTIYNTVISSIRAAESTLSSPYYHLILLEGTDYSGMHSWTSSGNSAAFANGQITDPQNNFAINVHQYFDSNYSGTQDSECISTSNVTSIVETFYNWLVTNNYRAIVTETGGNYNFSTCPACVNQFLQLLAANASAVPSSNTSPGFIGWTGWSGGSIDPDGVGKLSVSPQYTRVNSSSTKILKESPTMLNGFAPNLTPP